MSSSSNIGKQQTLPLDEILPSKSNTYQYGTEPEKSENISTSRSPNRPKNLGFSIKMSSIRINKLKDRIFILSPKVKSGEDRESNMEDFYLLEESVKYGCLGSLTNSIHKVSKVKYALKIIKKEEIIRKNFVEKINTFIDTNYRLTNQNLIRFVNHFEEDNNLVFIYPYIKLNLLEHIEKNFFQDENYESTAMQYFIQAVGAVIFMNSNKKFNIDFRPENLMIDKQNLIRITDIKNKEIIYSFYQMKKDEKNISLLNPSLQAADDISIDYYTSPEENKAFIENDTFLIQEIDKSDKADVYRLGALLFHLATGAAPYKSFDNLGILAPQSTSTSQKKASTLKDFFESKNLCIFKSSAEKAEKVEQGQNAELPGTDLQLKPEKNQFPAEFCESADALVKWFMEKSSSKRPSIKELRESQILKNLLSKYKPASRESIDIKESQRVSLKKGAFASTSPTSPFIDSALRTRKIVQLQKALITSESKQFQDLAEDEKIRILLDENCSLKKQNEKYRLENLRLENENRILASEMNHIQNSYDKDRKSIEEEKKRMNTLNQDRICKINELDEITNEIIELKSRLRMLENEKELMEFDLKEATDSILEMEKNIEDMNLNFERERSEFEIKLENLNRNLKRYQKYFLGGEGEVSNFFKDDESMKRFAVALYDLVKEFKETLDHFTISNFTEKAEILYHIEQMLSDKEEVFKRYINKVKEDFVDEYLRISLNQNSFKPADKVKARLEWVQKQVKELTPFKIKSINLERQNNILMSENKRYAEVIFLKNTEIDLLKKLNEGLTDNITVNKDYIVLIESKLEVVKSFVIKNLPQNSEELKNLN